MELDLSKKYPNVIVKGIPSLNEYCIVTSRVHGLFACFYCILYGLYICELEGLRPLVLLDKDHLYYQKEYGENIFNYFFEQTEFDADQYAKITVIHPDPFIHWSHISTNEKLNANLLVNKYFNLKTAFDDALTVFFDAHFSNCKVLGVHYRGRDKIQETNLLEFDEYLKKIDLILREKICDKIFFSTDELELRASVKNRYGDKLILYPLEGAYSDGLDSKELGLHYDTLSPFLHAKDALFECYLLASSTFLLSSHKSSMSLFATFFNPELLHLIIEP